MQKTVDFFQLLNNDELVTSVQEVSDPVNDETDEDEDNNCNECSKDPSNAYALSALQTAMEWYEQQSECCPTQLTGAQENQRPCSEKTKVYNGTAKNKRLFSTIKCPVSDIGWIAFGFRLSEQSRIRSVSAPN
ncbi:hypothetical protein TNCV_4440251 [Trichonephila clavipes]|nr:hypothetical protein TNCV_4440251 [Trichonephila clavipes]